MGRAGSARASQRERSGLEVRLAGKNERERKRIVETAGSSKPVAPAREVSTDSAREEANNPRLKRFFDKGVGKTIELADKPKDEQLAIVMNADGRSTGELLDVKNQYRLEEVFVDRNLARIQDLTGGRELYVDLPGLKRLTKSFK